MIINYDAPTPETDAFMNHIDDSEIDLGQVRSKLQTLEVERNATREVLNECVATIHLLLKANPLSDTYDLDCDLDHNMPKITGALDRAKALEEA